MINKSRAALLISILVTSAVVLLIFLKIISLHTGFSILVGISISTLNFLLFILGYANSVKKSNNTFLLFTIGGIGVRLLIVLLMVIISIKLLKVALLGFIFALFIWYVFYLIFEISIVRRGLEGR